MNLPKLKTLFQEVTKDLSIITLIISLVMFTFGQTYYMIASILLFSAFDYIGFQRILKQDPEMKGLIPYRILQTALQYSLIYFLAIHSLTDAFWFFMFWWFGLYDLLFYIIGLEPFWKYGRFTWLWWTPIGIFYNFFDFYLGWEELVGSSLFVIALYVISQYLPTFLPKII